MTKGQHGTGTKWARAYALGLAAAMFVVLNLVSMPPLAAADTVTDANVVQLAASAKTAADHEALATYFRNQAAAAGEKVKVHEEVLAAVKKGGGKASSSWKAHCKSLIAMYKDLQKEAESMAKEHESLAKKAGK